MQPRVAQETAAGYEGQAGFTGTGRRTAVNHTGLPKR